MTRAPLTNVPFVEPDVLDPEAVGPRLEHGVACRGEVVAVEPDRILAAASESRRLPQLDRRTRLQGRAVEHEDAGNRDRDDGLVAGSELVRLLAR